MWGRRNHGRLGLYWILAATWLAPDVWAQGPVLQESGIVTSSGVGPTPGSLTSRLGATPGASGISMGLQPGRDEMLLGRIGAGVPRVPTSVSTPGGVYQGPPPAQGMAAPQPLPVPRPLLYGTLELPVHEAEEGPPDGLTLDQAIDLLLRQGLDLRVKSLELPQARADVLTASLRANPIFFADAQLIPYGVDSVRKPDGPLQYDVNVSYPLDFSLKRLARKAYASRSLEVMEAQYQNEVRLAIQNLYNAYIDVLAARETVHYAQTSIKGLEDVLRAWQALYEKKTATSADVDQARADRASAAVGLLDAEEAVRQRKRTLGELLNLSPEQAERLELRGRITDIAPPPPPQEELLALALSYRPDIAAFRLGIAVAEANFKLQKANQFSDAYLLYQPFTFQNNAPYGKQSGASWAVGITVPTPLYNRNQGNIARAKINIHQSELELAYQERRVATEVAQAINEYRASGEIVRKLRQQVIPTLKRAYEARSSLFREGEATKFAFLDSQRKYNEMGKTYLDALVRHRRSMLLVNTVIGQRMLP
jgi:cobalt-zinc-cadmium efflux system outer membrane protein